MFKHVKKKLTLLYTFSLLFLLILFITVLYFFISHEVEHNEQKELSHFLNKEKHEIIEDYYENEHFELEFDPHKKIFFYVYSETNQLLLGEETLKGLSNKIGQLNRENVYSDSEIMTDTWDDTHFTMIKETLSLDDNQYATVYVGMDTTNEKHFIQSITWILLGLTVLFSLLFGFMGNYFAGQAMKPISKAFDSQRKFVSDASHELRTPLSIFYSSIELLMREEKESLSPFGQEVLQDMKLESEMMNKLISDLLFLARSDNSHLEIDKKKINLTLLMNSLKRRISSSVPPNIDFLVDLEDDIIFYGDEFRIQQLVYILIDNAFRYTKEGKVKLALQKQNDSIKLTIEDSGTGISETDLPHIFDRFYRGDKSRVRDGSGLGLSIAKSIVTAHEGKIFAKSELGVGTLFTVVFKYKEGTIGEAR